MYWIMIRSCIRSYHRWPITGSRISWRRNSFSLSAMKIEPGSSCELSMLRKKLLGMPDIFVLLHYGTLLGHLEIIIAPPVDARYRFN